MRTELPTATVAEGDGLRTLHLGDTPWVQGAMLVRQPRVIVLEYVQRMMAWMLWRDSADVSLRSGNTAWRCGMSMPPAAAKAAWTVRSKTPSPTTWLPWSHVCRACAR